MITIIGFVVFVGLITTGVVNAMNTFLNPRFWDFSLLYWFCSPAGNTVIQAGGGTHLTFLQYWQYRSNYVLLKTTSHLKNRITWKKDPSQPTISMVLKNNRQSIVLINQEPNTGSFIWDVPEILPSGTYTLEIGAGAPLPLCVIER